MIFPFAAFWFCFLSILAIASGAPPIANPKAQPPTQHFFSNAAPEITWCPMSEQWALTQWLTLHRPVAGFPNFQTDQTDSALRVNIYSSLEAVSRRGVTTLDFQYVVANALLEQEYASPSSAPPPPAGRDTVLNIIARSNEIWLQEVETFNARHPGKELAIRLRLTAQAAFLHSVFRTFKPYKTKLAKEDFRNGKIRSSRPNLPLDPCFGIESPKHPCFASSPIPAGYYQSRNEDGTYNPTVLNLANPAIREAIGAWAGVLLKTAMDQAPHSRIEEMSLALDAGSESSLFPSDAGGVVSFGNRFYDPKDNLTGKKTFFKERESILKATYSAFCAAVHARRNRDATPVRAGIFQQGWGMDGRSRGTFDLYDLLKGTGVDILHHTQMPLPGPECLMAVAYSASVANALGIGFDTEFSWAHFGADMKFRGDTLDLPDGAAEKFLAQALAGLRYGAVGITYADWTRYEMLFPSPSRAWQRITAGAGEIPNRKMIDSIPAFRNALPPLSTPTQALFIGSAGRMECEELRGRPQGNRSPCDLSTYFRWFRDFELVRGKDKASALDLQHIAILTDGMIRDRVGIPAELKTIFVPYEVSLSLNAATAECLSQWTDQEKQKIRWQKKPHVPASGSYAEWMQAVRILN